MHYSNLSQQIHARLYSFLFHFQDFLCPPFSPYSFFFIFKVFLRPENVQSTTGWHLLPHREDFSAQKMHKQVLRRYPPPQLSTDYLPSQAKSVYHNPEYIHINRSIACLKCKNKIVTGNIPVFLVTLESVDRFSGIILIIHPSMMFPDDLSSQPHVQNNKIRMNQTKPI